MRLFIAVNFGEEMQERLGKIIQKLQSQTVKGSFTRRENLHLTLVFIGETEEVDSVIRAMQAVSAPSFILDIQGMGSFRRSGGDIYWLGVEHNPTLVSIYNQLCLSLRAAGFPMEKRKFKPHLTLGRRVVFPDFDSRTWAELPPLRQRVDKISLMKSERIAGKLTYTEIFALHLD